jgi:flagellar biosynthesis/type III secretory pathway chaperone
MRNTEEQINLLEDILVSEFRLLQNLVAVTQEESATILKGSLSILASIVEDKEVIIDQIASLEDNRQKTLHQLAQSLGARAQPLSVQSMLPYFEKDQSERVHRLLDGISALSDQEHVMNLNVSTLAKTRIDLIHSTRLNLLSFCQPPVATYHQG